MIGGIRTSLTSDFTMTVNDAPKTNATARSTTLPREMKRLYSLNNAVP